MTGESVELSFVDQGYTGDEADADAASYGIHLVVVSLAEAKKGFVLLPRRWVVERSYGWMARFRRLGAGLRAAGRDPGGAALRRLQHVDASQGRPPFSLEFITRSRRLEAWSQRTWPLESVWRESHGDGWSLRSRGPIRRTNSSPPGAPRIGDETPRAILEIPMPRR